MNEKAGQENERSRGGNGKGRKCKAIFKGRSGERERKAKKAYAICTSTGKRSINRFPARKMAPAVCRCFDCMVRLARLASRLQESKPQNKGGKRIVNYRHAILIMLFSVWFSVGMGNGLQGQSSTTDGIILPIQRDNSALFRETCPP